MNRIARLLLITLAVIPLAGCMTFGPGTIARDRYKYSDAIATSWQQEVLLNIVKLRYADIPMFMDVSSVINSYEVRGDVSTSWNYFEWDYLSHAFGGAGSYADRPTITYSPIVGARFSRSMMTPIPPPLVFHLLQADWPADFVFRLTVNEINGIRNNSGRVAIARASDAEFSQLLDAMALTQQSGAIDLRVRKTLEGEDTVVIFGEEVSPDLAETRTRTRDILGLDPDEEEVRLAYGSLPSASNELAILTRSLFEIMVELSAGVDVPEHQIEQGRASRIAFPPEGKERLLHVKTQRTRPRNDFVSVKYRGRWYWIDDRDMYSKRTFSILMIFFSLVETGQQNIAPLVTIPTS